MYIHYSNVIPAIIMVRLVCCYENKEFIVKNKQR